MFQVTLTWLASQYFKGLIQIVYRCWYRFVSDSNLLNKKKNHTTPASMKIQDFSTLILIHNGLSFTWLSFPHNYCEITTNIFQKPVVFVNILQTSLTLRKITGIKRYVNNYSQNSWAFCRQQVQWVSSHTSLQHNKISHVYRLSMQWLLKVSML